MMTITQETVTASAAGVVLICDHASTASALAEGSGADLGEPAIYSALASAVLQRSRLDVVFHLRRGRVEGAAIREAIERCRVSPDQRARLQVIEGGPLEIALPRANFLVSFASLALVKGCRNGLKPVQIGRALTGSAAFSHVFPDLDSVVDALATSGLEGQLSVREYEQFEAFCQVLCSRDAVAARDPIGRLRTSWRLGRDPIVRECRRSEPARCLALRTIASALANPVAALRLLRVRFDPSGRPVDGGEGARPFAKGEVGGDDDGVRS